jgi:Beta/Gamma crystallin
MRPKIVIYFVFSFFLLMVFLVEAQTSVPYVMAYKEKGFRGKSQRYDVGDYGQLEDWKDDIQSVQLIGGVRIVLYDKEQYQGKNMVVERSTADLGDFREKAASLRVEPFQCQVAIAYKKTTFEGTPREFPVGEYRTLTNGWEDEIQSIDICGNVRVTLYDKKEFEGDKETVEKGTIDLGKFRKKAASMIVEATVPPQ